MSLVNPRDRRFLPALKGGVSAPGRFYDKHKATHDNSCHRVLVTVHQHRYRVGKGRVLAGRIPRPSGGSASRPTVASAETHECNPTIRGVKAAASNPSLPHFENAGPG